MLPLAGHVPATDDDRRLAVAYLAARRSWLWPLIALLGGSLIAEFMKSWAMPFLTAIVVVFGIGAYSLLSAAYALATVPPVGRRSIRTSALLGLVVGGALILGAIGAVIRLVR